MPPFDALPVKERVAAGIPPVTWVQVRDAIFPLVRGPAIPLVVIPLSPWNALVAARVALPKYPVGLSFRYPLS